MDTAEAVSRLIERVDDTLANAVDRFSMYADPETGEWTWSDDGGWLGGFWPGLLWLSAVATRDDRYAQEAGQFAKRLGPRAGSATILRGFLFWYGAGLGVDGHDTSGLATMAVDAARSLRADFDSAAQLLPPGEEDAAKNGWPRPGACIDGLPGAIRLLTFAAEQTRDRSLRDMALMHARGHQAMCVRPDGSVAQAATYDRTGSLTSQIVISGAPWGTWSRAQAWAMLGLTQAAQVSPEFLPAAIRVCDWYLTHVPDDFTCYWDFGDPAIPDTLRDTSATAIAASALLKLSPLASERYRAAGERTVEALARDHMGAAGGLVDGCYNKAKGLATCNELIWGDYFMLEAALSIEGLLEPARL